MSINISIPPNSMTYSIDFRKKVLAAYKNKEGCMRDIADRFNVSLIFVFTLWRRYKETGDVIPKPHGGGASRKINEAGEVFIKNALQKRNDMTENDLCEAYLRKFNVVVSQSTMNRTLNRLNYTLKKKLFQQPKRKAPKSKP